MRILITDDHAAVRRCLREMLADALPGACFSEAADVAGALNALTESPFSLLLLDINMPGRNGIDALRDIKLLHPNLPVIMLSVQPESLYAARCLRAGAAAYVNKEGAPESLIQAISMVLTQEQRTTEPIMQ